MSNRSPITVARQCANADCGKTFLPPHGHTKVCSPECRTARDKATKANRRKPVAEKICNVCTKPFRPNMPHAETCTDQDCRRIANGRRAAAWKINHPGYYDGYWKIYYAKNRARQIAAAKAYYQANREERIAVMRAYALAHPERHREARRRYKKTDRGRIVDLANVHRRLARKRGAAGFATAEQMTARWNYYGGMCWMCGRPADQWDHVIALARGGSGWASNLRPACAPHNMSKGARDHREFAPVGGA